MLFKRDRSAESGRKPDDASKAKKSKRPNKAVLGLAALAATAIVGTTGVAAAQTSAQASAGYGGNTANFNLSLDISGDNNVINIIINAFPFN